MRKYAHMRQQEESVHARHATDPHGRLGIRSTNQSLQQFFPQTQTPRFRVKKVALHRQPALFCFSFALGGFRRYFIVLESNSLIGERFANLLMRRAVRSLEKVINDHNAVMSAGRSHGHSSTDSASSASYSTSPPFSALAAGPPKRSQKANG